MKTNIFNFLKAINNLEKELKQTKEELATVKQLNAVANSLTGLEIVKEQTECRRKIIDELYPPTVWDKEITHLIDKNIVDQWIQFLEGQYNAENFVEVRNDRSGFTVREKDKLIFKYYEILNTISIQIL